MESIDNLDHDWSQIVTEQGQQVATVGHHFKLSRAFNRTELDHISRSGTCTACHQEIPSESLAVSLLHHVAEYAGQLPKRNDQHLGLVHKIVLSSAWAQVIGAGMALLGLAAAVRLSYRRITRFFKK